MSSTRIILAVILVCASASAQLPDNPTWGHTPFRASASNSVFATADGCAHCHSHSDGATALTGPSGEDVSPHGLWRATMMANAMRDPYFRAQLAKETLLRPNAAASIEGLCITCHAPMARHTADIAGFQPARVHELDGQELASDGVSCTVCHQALPDDLGREQTWGGRLNIGLDREIFGPYEDPVGAPMTMHTAFTPTHGAHIRDAGLCGSCHTLETRPVPGAPKFLEQGPFLEWSNSEFAREEDGRTCQQCHMPDLGPTRIARNPPGGEFLIPVREEFRGHQFVGGNAWMLDLFATHREELGVTAPAEALRRTARATRKQLAEQTASATIERIVRTEGGLEFDVRVENLTGHKLPTGYPSRRMWLHVDVLVGRRSLFSSGAVDAAGRIVGIGDALAQPHRDEVRSPGEVPIWEAIAVDGEGMPTTSLISMTSYRKDDRILPRGWRADGPWADRTAPVGTAGDATFVAGEDRVRYFVPVARELGRTRIIARLRYQTVPPAWVDSLRGHEDPAIARFLRLYDETPAVSEVLSTATEFVD